jgi:transposase
MAMGKRKKQQRPMWVTAAELPKSPGHPFYGRLNGALEAKGFDRFVEGLCKGFYAKTVGRPSLTPGRYFRLLLLGYFEGIDSERGIAWRASDSLSIRSFVRIALDESVPDHSTISRTRRLMDVETHQAVFQWVLGVLAEKKLLKGNTIGVDATTLEANAALRSIVRRDTGEKYEEFLTRLAKESGHPPTRDCSGDHASRPSIPVRSNRLAAVRINVLVESVTRRFKSKLSCRGVPRRLIEVPPSNRRRFEDGYRVNVDAQISSHSIRKDPAGFAGS